VTYTNPDALTETLWLAEHLGDPNVKVLDASFHLPGTGRDVETEFSQRHIPGAMLFDIEDVRDHTIPLPHMLPSAERFGEQMGTLGISNDDFVVIYDVHGVQTAPRAWWTFRAFGHKKVAVLNGGLPKWLAENRPTSDDIADPPRAVFRAKLIAARVRNIDQMLANQESRAALVLDARPAGRFVGADPEPRDGIRSGHMPGSVNLPIGKFIDSGTKTFLPADGLLTALADIRVDPQQNLVTTCGSGVAACLISLGLHLLGNENVPVYDGSWSQWGARDDTPIE
jgi:thiosulfate/3-mercaptopyruvate sulfurtransferase